MKLLLDECVPRRLRQDFFGHEVFTIEKAGFKVLKNGNLLEAASKTFEVLITVDKNIKYQQNKDKLSIAVIILSAKSNRYETLSTLVPKALKILETIKIGEIILIE